VAMSSLAIASCPVNPEAHLQRGLAYGQMQERRKAIADYSMFLALSLPDDKRRAEVLFRRSNNYQGLREEAESRADVIQLAELDLREVENLHEQIAHRFNELAWKLANGSEKDRATSAALTLARKAAAMAPGEVMYLNTLGVVQYRQALYLEAVAT